MTEKREQGPGRDMLTEITLAGYLRELLAMPEEPPEKLYNGCEGHKSGTATRAFARYRSLRLRERRLRVQLAETTALLLHAEKNGTEAGAQLRGRYRRTVLELSETVLRRRELERRCRLLESELAKRVIIHRYFTDPDRRLPSWEQTAKELGIAVSGAELARYVNAQLG
ncbi:MAG: hypothetical protein IJ737_01225 [Ruminococcus sp.]|nr:hypothetical protein [Ruminococcus sp.]